MYAIWQTMRMNNTTPKTMLETMTCRLGHPAHMSGHTLACDTCERIWHEKAAARAAAGQKAPRPFPGATGSTGGDWFDERD